MGSLSGARCALVAEGARTAEADIPKIVDQVIANPVEVTQEGPTSLLRAAGPASHRQPDQFSSAKRDRSASRATETSPLTIGLSFSLTHTNPISTVSGSACSGR